MTLEFDIILNRQGKKEKIGTASGETFDEASQRAYQDFQHHLPAGDDEWAIELQPSQPESDQPSRS